MRSRVHLFSQFAPKLMVSPDLVVHISNGPAGRALFSSLCLDQDTFHPSFSAIVPMALQAASVDPPSAVLVVPTSAADKMVRRSENHHGNRNNLRCGFDRS